MALVVAYVNKPKSKPLNASGLQNQNPEDKQLSFQAMANQITSFPPQFLFISLSPGSYQQHTPDHFWFGAAWFQSWDLLLKMLTCLSLSVNRSKDLQWTWLFLNTLFKSGWASSHFISPNIQTLTQPATFSCLSISYGCPNSQSFISQEKNQSCQLFNLEGQGWEGGSRGRWYMHTSGWFTLL